MGFTEGEGGGRQGPCPSSICAILDRIPPMLAVHDDKEKKKEGGEGRGGHRKWRLFDLAFCHVFQLERGGSREIELMDYAVKHSRLLTSRLRP